MRRTRHLFSFLAVSLAATGCTGTEPEQVTLLPGDPMPDLTEEELGRFLLGKAVFTRLTSVEEGLGPTYNEVRCSDCHGIPTPGGSSSIATRLSRARKWENGVCDPLTEEGGDILQKRATPLLVATGYEPPEQTPPSATYQAEEPALAMFGVGLIQEIPDEDILALADPDDLDGDGISGRPGKDVSGLPGVGRWTRKLERSRLYDLVDAALRRHLGLTTPRFPDEQTMNGVPVPPESDPMPDPEMDDRGIQIITDFIRFLAPPQREILTSDALRDSVEAGELLFEDVGCAACHVPTMYTGPNESAALDRKPVHFYSDMLLHDMGPESAGLCGFGAEPTEYRTAWLWGMRFKENWMRDGKASTLRQSIELHGGESAASRDAFDALTPEEQAYLLRFLASL